MTHLLFTGLWVLPLAFSCEKIGLSKKSAPHMWSLSYVGTYFWLRNTLAILNKSESVSCVCVFPFQHLRSQTIQLAVNLLYYKLHAERTFQIGLPIFTSLYKIIKNTQHYQDFFDLMWPIVCLPSSMPKATVFVNIISWPNKGDSFPASNCVFSLLPCS